MIHRNKLIVVYSVALGLLIFLLKWIEARFTLFSNSLDIYAGLIAVFFLGLGIWVTLKLYKPKPQQIIVEKEIPSGSDFKINASLIQNLELSNRELEILNLIAKGLSNEEIASTIFISLSTVKSHNQNLFEKLEVKRRTQAVDKARKIGLIP